MTTAGGTSATSSADQFTYNWTLTVNNGSQRKLYSLADLEAMTPVYSGYGGFLKGDPPYTVYQYTGTTLLESAWPTPAASRAARASSSAPPTTTAWRPSPTPT